MFVVAYEEQARTEEILRLALPQLRSKQLLLASFGNFEEENEQFKVGVVGHDGVESRVLSGTAVWPSAASGASHPAVVRQHSYQHHIGRWYHSTCNKH